MLALLNPAKKGARARGIVRPTAIYMDGSIRQFTRSPFEADVDVVHKFMACRSRKQEQHLSRPTDTASYASHTIADKVALPL